MEPTEIEKQGERFTIAEIKHGDIVFLKPILERWIQWEGQVLRKEVNETILKMSQAAEHRSDPLHPYHYVVVRNSEGDAIGCAGVGVPDERMLQYTSVNEGSNPAEMINVFLAVDMRGKGLGVELVNAARRKATELGYNELVWNSGPRYKDTAWGFYEKLVGEPVEAKHYYGIGYHAQVWRVTLP